MNHKKKVIIVGETSSCLDFKMGKKIDNEYDIIIRTSLDTEGYEEYVGNKKTIYSGSIRDFVFSNKLDMLINSNEYEKFWIKEKNFDRPLYQHLRHIDTFNYRNPWSIDLKSKDLKNLCKEPTKGEVKFYCIIHDIKLDYDLFKNITCFNEFNFFYTGNNMNYLNEYKKNLDKRFKFIVEKNLPSFNGKLKKFNKKKDIYLKAYTALYHIVKEKMYNYDYIGFGSYSTPITNNAILKVRNTIKKNNFKKIYYVRAKSPKIVFLKYWSFLNPYFDEIYGGTINIYNEMVKRYNQYFKTNFDFEKDVLNSERKAVIGGITGFIIHIDIFNKIKYFLLKEMLYWGSHMEKFIAIIFILEKEYSLEKLDGFDLKWTELYNKNYVNDDGKNGNPKSYLKSYLYRKINYKEMISDKEKKNIKFETISPFFINDRKIRETSYKFAMRNHSKLLYTIITALNKYGPGNVSIYGIFGKNYYSSKKSTIEFNLNSDNIGSPYYDNNYKNDNRFVEWLKKYKKNEMQIIKFNKNGKKEYLLPQRMFSSHNFDNEFRFIKLLIDKKWIINLNN